MTIVEVRSAASPITQRQRWGHYFALIYAVLVIIIGINLRDSAINSVTAYSNPQAGIRALYPQRWLIDTDGDYVFRVRNLASSGYKTTIQVAIEPVAATTSIRNLVDSLTLIRSQQFAEYKILSRDSVLLAADREALQVEYAYVASGDNVFLETLPIVVEGIDVIVIQRGQAVIISFLSDADTFEENLPIFERFLDDLSF